ncbi:hypothetical protein [Methylobacterium nodulans]|uniref:Uncharacterized protein n=1 Tax=Methylobacterium nodulans (strain LMG 21967 / CNCM I-2342 / ORS 2060) TaxID=460265 RepID=B8IAV3_METNO|nr:hypothetical protein [Methylobacterium nodulans]ACL55346.1 conserved hypothetical protein [Methylobacterium nodulans ORS 2060]
MPNATYLTPDEVEAYARAGEEALKLCLRRHLAEEQAAFWHAIRLCYGQSLSPLPAADLAALPAAAIPAPHVLQGAVPVELQ